MISTQDRLLNDFATRSFRDLADQDYITARMAYRVRLVPQFLWSSQQAIEKYLKCILLLHRVEAPQVGHDLEEALKVAKKLPFQLALHADTLAAIAHLNTYGRYIRYLEAPYYLTGHALPGLDATVWDLRRYCQVLHHTTQTTDPIEVRIFEASLRQVARSDRIRPSPVALHSGFLESVLAKSQNPAREHLIWQNLYFYTRPRKRIRYAPYEHSTNSPLYLHPEMLSEVARYVSVPKDVRVACEQHWLPRHKSEIAANRKAIKQP